MVRLRSSAFASIAVLSQILAGCSSDAEGVPVNAPVVETPATPPAATPSPLPFEISWGECTIPTGQGDSIDAECATVDAPGRRGSPGGGTTTVAVYRLRSKKQPATAQMWMLNGGPGGAGFSLAPYGKIVTGFPQGIDVYLVDHRGTGESDFLECPTSFATSKDATELMQRCSAEIRETYGDRVDGFSTTESAHDVRELIDSTAAPGQKVFVYGGSYGSYWAHRLLQLPNVRVDAVVTDGNCLGTTCTFDVPQTFGADEVMKFILDACKDSPECKTRLGDDPWAFAAATLEKLAQGHCAEAKLSAVAPADLAMGVGVYWAAGLLPTLFRLDRCSADDVKVLDVLAGRLEEINQGRRLVEIPVLGKVPKPSAATSYSQVLQLHVIGSEMISKPAPSASSLAAKAETLTWKPSSEGLDISMFDGWSGYPRDSYVSGWSTRDVPWLMMQGTFDFQTVYSLSQRALEQVKDPSLQFVRIDGGGHGVVFASSCSVEMLEGFFKDPKAKVDTSCLGELKASAVALDERYLQYFFGKTQAWD